MVNIGSVLTKTKKAVVSIGKAIRDNNQTIQIAKKTPLKGNIEDIEKFTDGTLEKLIDEFGGALEKDLKGIKNIINKLKNKPLLLKIFLEILKAYYGNLPAGAVKGFVQLSPDELLHAKIAKFAYNPVQSFEHLGKKYVQDGELTDDKSVVYFEEGQAETAIIGYRGTKPSNISDVISDVYIALGETENSPRFSDALEKYYVVKKKYEKCSITGHSLGGSQANFVARKTGADCYGFNGGWGLDADYKNWVNKYKNIKTYKIVGDPISLFFGIENIANIKIFDIGKTGLSAHSMENFI